MKVYYRNILSKALLLIQNNRKICLDRLIIKQLPRCSNKNIEFTNQLIDFN